MATPQDNIDQAVKLHLLFANETKTDLTIPPSPDNIDEGFFALLQQHDRRSVKPCALYNFIHSLRKQKNPSLQAHTLSDINTEFRKAFLFEFDLKETKSLFEGYQCTGSHLTIDALYSNEKSAKGIGGFTYAHYTERYQMNTSIHTVHVYFNQQGQYLFSKITDEKNKEQPMLPSLENMIKNNALKGNKTLLELLRQKNAAYGIASKEADKLEKKLSKRFKQLIEMGTQQAKDAYVITAKQFINKVKELNLLLDQRRDMRGALVEKRIQKMTLNGFLFNESVLGLSKTEVSAADETSTEAANTRSLSNENIEKTKELMQNAAEKIFDTKIKSALFCSLSLLKTQLTDVQNTIKTSSAETQTDLIIRAYNLSQEMLLLQIDLLSAGTLNPQEKQLLLITDQQINDISNFACVFTQLVEKGDTTSFKKLFESQEQQLHFDWYFTHIESMCDTKPTDKLLPAKIEICEFLFQKSEAYRLAIMSYQLLACYSDDLNYIAQSPLSQVAMGDNLALFKMLIQHGFNPNGLGLIIGDDVFPIFKSLLRERGKEEYLQYLLASGASVYNTQKTLVLDSKQIKHKIKDKKLLTYALSAARDLKKASNSASSSSQQLETQRKLKENLTSFSELFFAIEFNHYNLLPNLLAMSEPYQIACALGQYIIITEGGKALISSANEPGIAFFPSPYTQQQISAMVRSFSVASTTDTAPPIKHLIFPKGATNADALQTLQRCITKMPITSIDATIETLERLIEDSPAASLKNIGVYGGALILMSLKPHPTFMDRQKMISWYCKLGKLHYDTEPQKSLQYFDKARRIADEAHPTCQSALIQTPLYQHALKNIEKLKQVVAPAPLDSLNTPIQKKLSKGM